MNEQKKCPRCESTETTEVHLDDGPHYGKLICTKCGRHHRWLPKPKEPAGEPVPPWLHELAVRPHRSAWLDGAESQCQWAESIRTEMKAKHQHDAVMVGVLDAI